MYPLLTSFPEAYRLLASRTIPAGQPEFEYLIDYCDAQRVPWRMVLAVIPSEGNGSLNTSSTNKAGDGGNGYNADWRDDVQKAVNLIRGKMTFFCQAQAQGWTQLARTVTGEIPNPYMFINWYNPILRGDGSVDEGVYAQHASWWRNVKGYHEKFGGSVGELYESCEELDKTAPRLRMTFRIVVDETDWASNWNATAPEPAVIVTSYEVTGPPPAVVAEVAPSMETIVKEGLPATVIIDGVETPCNAVLVGDWLHADIDPLLLLLQRYGVRTEYHQPTRTMTITTPTTP